MASEPSRTPKLSLFSLPSQPPEPQGMLTPPLQTTASVPFKWEEAPGKPRDCGGSAESKPKCARSLELPPRLQSEAAKITNTTSPTTVLDGPDDERTMSFSFRDRSPGALGSKRLSKESCRSVGGGGGGGGFGSMRWASFRKNKEVVDHGGFDFLPPASGGGETKVKITRVRRTASFLNSSNTRSRMWASICESFKQVVPVPWRRKQEKLRNMTS
ncbi:uncharacterized protein At4g00950 isoform X1 [Pyrus x bretschneideri]|uniref:uncharacterized protein At4g00950 isoform X1 n=1 Tax=Pyrus x bretschneideri TaxID=225117 RepID=UPI0020309C74|nr:uncharacterized protein At4g00950 isoform X1 [Pyrus x bretschneideri]